MTKVYAIYMTGPNTPRVEVFASEADANRCGNGFLIVAKQEDFMSEYFKSAMLVELYNAMEKSHRGDEAKPVKAFNNKTIAAERCFKLMKEIYGAYDARAALGGKNAEADEGVISAPTKAPMARKAANPASDAPAEANADGIVRGKVKKEKVARAPREDGAPRLRLKGKVLVLSDPNMENPHREGGGSHKFFEMFRAAGASGCAYEDLITAGVRSSYLSWMQRHYPGVIVTQ